jgi:hypothetical protein
MSRSPIREYVRHVQKDLPNTETAHQLGFGTAVLILLGWRVSVLDAKKAHTGVPGATHGHVATAPGGPPLCAVFNVPHDKIESPLVLRGTALQQVPVFVRTNGLVFKFQSSTAGSLDDGLVVDVRDGDPDAIAEILDELLGWESIMEGTALASLNTRTALRDRERRRQQLASTFNGLLSVGDELLVDLLVETAEQEGVRDVSPEEALSVVRSFHRRRKMPVKAARPPQDQGSPAAPSGPGFMLGGRWHTARSARRVLQSCLVELEKRRPGLLETLGGMVFGRTRRLVARDPMELYPGRPDLSDRHLPLVKGWVVAVNHNKKSIFDHLRRVSEVAGIEFGRELVVVLG